MLYEALTIQRNLTHKDLFTLSDFHRFFSFFFFFLNLLQKNQFQQSDIFKPIVS